MTRWTIPITLAITLAIPRLTRAQTPEWDESAASEIEALTRRIFDAWQARNSDGVRAEIDAEYMLGSYDNDERGRPVSLMNVEEQIMFAQKMWSATEEMGAKTTATIEEIDCQATATMGVCALEFAVDITHEDGNAKRQLTHGTLIARRGEDGWKATHWHASPAALPEAPEPDAPAPIPALSVNPKELEWNEIPDSGGVKAAVVWQDPKAKTNAAFVKFPKKWKRGRHYHSHASQNVLLKGTMSVIGSDGLEENYKANAWLFSPGNWIHATECKRDATLFSITYGPRDAVNVDEKGNPITQPATPEEPAK